MNTDLTASLPKGKNVFVLIEKLTDGSAYCIVCSDNATGREAWEHLLKLKAAKHQLFEDLLVNSNFMPSSCMDAAILFTEDMYNGDVLDNAMALAYSNATAKLSQILKKRKREDMPEVYRNFWPLTIVKMGSDSPAHRAVCEAFLQVYYPELLPLPAPNDTFVGWLPAACQ